MFRTGYLTLLRWRGVPLKLHWTIPVGAVLLGRFAFVPGFWVGFFFLVLAHELGHALVVRLCGQQVLAVEVTGLGGVCRWQGHATPLARAAIAWGGVWAQLLVFAAAGLFLLLRGLPSSWFAAQLLEALLWGNVWLMLLNLLPIPPLDGKEAWPLFSLLGARLRRRRAAKRKERMDRTLRKEMRKLDALDQEGRLISQEAKSIVARALDEIDRQRGVRK